MSKYLHSRLFAKGFDTPLHADLAAGNPRAIQYLQETYGLTLAQAKAAVASAQGQQASQPVEERIPDGVLDPELWKQQIELRKTFEQRQQEMQAQLKLALDKVSEIQGRAEAEKQRMELDRTVTTLRQKHVDTMLAIADRDPEYKVASGDLRTLLSNYLFQGVTDPRIEKHLTLLRTAQERQLPDVEMAYLLKNQDRFSQAIIEAEKRGREQMQRMPEGATGLSSVRSSGSEGGSPLYTSEQVRAMNEGRMPPPREWFTNGTLDRNKVPRELHGDVFG